MEDDEYVQLTIPEAFIYKCPARTSAQGYKASDWTEQVAIVKVVVVTKGRDVLIKLYRTEGDKLFAICPIRKGGPAGIEPVTDSSRYFCLRLENDKGNHAFVGIGFNRREDAFDLKSSIADAQKQAEAEEKGVAGGIDLGIGDMGGDFSLKQGQSLSIKIGGTASGKTISKPAASGSSGGGKLRAPGEIASPTFVGGPAPTPAPAPAPASTWESF